jgi:phosphoglycolate phosphatase
MGKSFDSSLIFCHKEANNPNSSCAVNLRVFMVSLLGLIFDLDGTLVDSAADLRQALNGLLASHARRALTLDEVKSMTGDGLNPMLQRAFAITGDEPHPEALPALFDDFLRHYKNQKASPEQLYPEAAETIRAFRDRGVKIGLCTNKLHMPTMKLLDEIGIVTLFDFVAGSDTFPVFKPDPGHVLGVARALKAPPQNCAMIGDSINDIRAAQGAKIASIAVSHGYGRDLHTLGADAMIANFHELPDALRRLGFDVVG